MDINSLLSPQDAPARNPLPIQSAPLQAHALPKKRPRPLGGKRTTSALSQEITISPEPPEPPRSVPQLGPEAVAQAQQLGQRAVFSNAYSPLSEVRTPLSNIESPGSESRSPFSTPQHHLSPAFLHPRPASTPQTDNPSDLASIQSHSLLRQGIAASDLNSPQRSPAITAMSRAMAPQLSRNLSAMSSTDLVMAEAPAQTPEPRQFTSTSLSDVDLQLITDLASYLADHSYDYNSHVQLINLLHQGLVTHAENATSDAASAPNPGDYSLLPDLRQAREAMESRFAVGEAIWKDWIEDEKLLAKSSEERQGVVELCAKAVQEEPASVQLWQLYGEWVWSIHAQANDLIEADSGSWTEEDKMICQELFPRQMVLSVFERATNATKWRIDQSHVIWNRYVELIMQGQPENPSPQAIEDLRALYMIRVQIPHETLDATLQSFWPFISKYNSQNWEEIMSATNDMAAPARFEIGLRQEHEHALSKAMQSGDQTALYDAFTEYLASEAKRRKKGPMDVELRSSLFERALLAFPSLSDWWLDYADYLVTAVSQGPFILSVLERATRHCPWTGGIWARRLLRAELEQQSYNDIENIKHKATNSGLLENGGMEEFLKVLTAWCGYLRRRAFQPNSTDDDVDMADMGIGGAMEDVQVAGKKMYGEQFAGDPLWRIEKIHIKFLSQAGRLNETRAFLKSLIPTHKNTHDFWLRYYEWEMFIWSLEKMAAPSKLETPQTVPTLATQVLRDALKQKDLDWPEKLLEIYNHHFDMHETPEHAEMAISEIRVAEKQIRQRRAKEAADAAAAAAEQAGPLEEETAAEDYSVASKRKRDEEPAMNGESAVKRNKVEGQESADEPQHEASDSASALVKRDREHNTITVKNLPADVTEKRLRQFFSDCGKIMSVAILAESDAMTATATIEFESHEDVQSARTRDGKQVDGQAIRIQSGTLSTLYVANYPEDYDEVNIRGLFRDFGTITSVRFPSLKFNNRRRFCYVQFLTTDEAKAATALDDKALDGRHRLVAKISDPDAKKHRSGATAEGRELHVGNVEHSATEQEIRNFFSTAGRVETVRMIRQRMGKFTGTAFIVYQTADEANAAIVFHQKPFKDRLLRVVLATDKSSRDASNQKLGSTTIVRSVTSASPAPESNAGSPPGGVGNDSTAAFGDDTSRTKHQRSVALLNVPDTVNDARIRSVMEQHGSIHKIVVRRDKGGALVEYVNLEDAGKVGMGIDCSSLGPECRVGTYAELNGRKAKGNKAPTSGSTSVKPNPTMMRPAQAGVSRPPQRDGRRGGLGFKRGGLGSGASRGEATKAETGDEGASATTNGTAAKSNADFRNMFVKGNDEAKEGGEQGEAN